MSDHHNFKILKAVPTPNYEQQWMANAIENEMFGVIAVIAMAVFAALYFRQRWYYRLTALLTAFGGGVLAIWLLEILHMTRNTPFVPVVGGAACAVLSAYGASEVLKAIEKKNFAALKGARGIWLFKCILGGLASIVLFWITFYTLPAALLIAFILYSGRPLPDEQPQTKQQPQRDAAGDAKKFDALLLRADKGDAAAQFELGRMYEQGQGVERSDIGALGWYQKAAAQGHAQAKTLVAAIESRLGLT